MTNDPIYGFDLGHGETAVSLAGTSSRVEARNLQIAKGGAKVIPTVVATEPDGRIIIGEDALLSQTAVDRRAAFKHPDVDRSDVSEPVRRFVRGVFDEMAAIGSPINGRLVFGHPSGWTAAQSSAYRSLLAAEIGQDPMMVPEARAAFLPLKSTGELSQQQIDKGRIVIVDMGSSTTDFALVQGVADPVDLGNPGGVQLGAGLIELALYQEALAELDPTDRRTVEDFLKAHTSEYVQVIVEFRRTKERFFTREEQHRSSGRGERADLETLEEQLGIDWRPKVDAAKIDKILNTPLDRLGVTADLFDRPISIDRGWSDEFFGHLEFAFEQLSGEPTAIVLTGGAAKMGWVFDEVRSRYPAADVIRTAEPEHTIANGLALHGSAFERTEAVRAEIDALVESSAIEDVVGETWDEGAATIVGPIVEGFVERFVVPSVKAWRNGDVRSLDDIGDHAGSSAKRWAESSDGKAVIGGAAAEWYSQSVAPAVNVRVRSITDKYPDIPSGAVEIPAQGLSVEIDASGTSGAVSGGDLLDDLDVILNGVLIVVSGVVATVMFGAGSAIVMATGPGAVVAAAVVGALALIVGKDEALAKLKNADVPNFARKVIPEDFLVGRIRNQRGEIEGEMRRELVKALRENTAAKSKVSMEIGGLIDSSLKQRVRDASAYLV